MSAAIELRADYTADGRTLKRLGFRVLTARPQAYGQAPGAIEAFKKNFPAAVVEVHRRRRAAPVMTSILW